MYTAAARLKQLHHTTRLTKAFKSDLQWWHLFVTNWNGISFIDNTLARPFNCHIQTDASGHWGCGACFGHQWLQHAWALEWEEVSIMAKELVPIVFSCAVWGPWLTRSHTEFQCDNLSLVEDINKGTSKDLMVMHLLRCLWFFQALFNINIRASHIPGVLNISADMLSRNQTEKFLLLYPQSSRTPVPIPSPLLQMVSPHKLDWTSPSFLQYLKQTIAIIQHSSEDII